MADTPETTPPPGEPALRKRASAAHDGGGGDADSGESGGRLSMRDVHMTRYRSLLDYHYNTYRAQMLLMVVLWAVLALFIWLHDTPPALHLRKILFAYFFMPVYTVIALILFFTRARHELNDFVGRIALVSIGFGSAYLALSLFNSVLLALEMSERV